MGPNIRSRPVRVLEVMEATIGGTKRHLLALVRGLDRQQFQVEIAAPRIRSEAFDDVSFSEEIQQAGLKQHYVPMVRAISPAPDLTCFFRLLSIMRRGGYDVVHTHSSKAGFLGRFAARAAGIRATVHTPHGFYFLNQPGGRKRAFFLELERLVGHLTGRMVVLSPTELREALDNRIIAPNRAALIENGIQVPEVPAPEAIARMREQLAPGAARLVGTVARITLQKGPFDFVKMAAAVAKASPGTHLVWCGDGELRKPVEALAGELGVADRLHFLGFRTDVMDVMATMDIFVLTSTWEGLPYTVLDAMALQKPVVATAAVGTRDIVRDGVTGLLTPVGDPEAAAGAVTRLLSSPEEAKSMGESGRQIILQRYSQEAMVKRTGHLYLDLVALASR